MAGGPAIETIHGDFRDEAGLRTLAAEVRRAGFRGMIHPAQVDPINEEFTPSETEIANAREIVDLFAANPRLGTIGHKGKMLDRPHLTRARAVLARVTERIAAEALALDYYLRIGDRIVWGRPAASRPRWFKP